MRLTEKCKNNYVLKREMLRVGKDALLVANELTNKLGQLEDIEEELGIDLDTLFKALKNGIWVKYSSAIIEHKTWYVHLTGHYIGWKENSGSLYDNDRVENRPLKDYGKTWSLNKEELL